MAASLKEREPVPSELSRLQLVKRREPSHTRFLHSQPSMSVGPESMDSTKHRPKYWGKVLGPLIVYSPFSSVTITLIYISCTLHQVV